MYKGIWTASKVEERLQEAAATLRRLPPVRVGGYSNLWPAIVHDANDKHDWETIARRSGPPGAQAIDRMEQTLAWFKWVTPDEHRLIWLRANNVRWKAICWRMGCCRTEAWKHWLYTLAKIAYQLNHEKLMTELTHDKQREISL